MSTKLYKGEIKVEFNEGSHRYKVNGKVVPGVTGVLSVINKPALMLWPMEMALKHIGGKKDQMTGEWTVPTEKTVTQNVIQEASVAFTKKSDRGKEVGTLVHERVELILKGGRPDTHPDRQVEKATNAFIKWYDSHDVEVLGTEQVVHSRELNYCGTYDFLIRMGGKTYLGDLKTTNASPRHAPQGIYPEAWLQNAAYGKAFLENAQYEGSDTEIDDFMVINASKEGELTVCTASELGYSTEDLMRGFKAAFVLWSMTNDLKKILVKRGKDAKRNKRDNLPQA